MIQLQRCAQPAASGLAEGSADGQPQRGVSLRHVLDGQGRATRFAWSPDGSLLAVPSRDGTIRVYDFASGALQQHLRGHAEAVLTACWSPDGRHLASGGYDQQLMLWGPFVADDDRRQPALGEAFASGPVRCLARLGGHSREINAVAWSCTGLLVSSAEDGRVIVRDPARDWAIVRTLPVAAATHCAWSPDGRQLAVGTEGGGIEVWDALAGDCEQRIAAAEAPVVMLAWSPDGTSVACASKERGLVVWDPMSARVRRDLRGHGTDVVAVAFSADGRLLASKSRDHTVVLWRADEGWPVALLREQATATGWCVGLAFHPRERVLAAAGDEEEVVRVWSLDAELCVAARGVLTEHPPTSVERSPLPDFLLARARERRRVVLV